MAVATVHSVLLASRSSGGAENQPDWCPPFRKVPGSRRFQSKPRPEKDHEVLKALKSLAKKHFHAYRVSPLYMFSYPRLQHYAQMLETFLTAEVKCAGDPTTNNGFHTNISVLPGLAIGQRDPEAILIQIFCTQEQKRPAWEGLLCCVEPEPSYLTVCMPFVLLPLLLVHGPQKFTTASKTWFERTFDCCISPLVIPSYELAWMAAMWAGAAMSVPRTLDLKWSSPPSVSDGLHITMSVNWNDALRLWDCVHTSGEEEVTAQEVGLFKQGLEEHIFYHFHVMLDTMILESVSSGVASANNSGHIKLFDVQNIPCTLRLLTDIALQGSQVGDAANETTRNPNIRIQIE